MRCTCFPGCQRDVSKREKIDACSSAMAAVARIRVWDLGNSSDTKRNFKDGDNSHSCIALYKDGLI